MYTLWQNKEEIMEKLSLDTINESQINEMGEGKALLKSLGVNVSSKGTEYISGTLFNKESIPMIMWNIGEVFTQTKNNADKIVGSIVEVTYKVIEFSGRHTASIQSMRLSDETDVTEYMKIKYNKDVYTQAVLDILRKNMSGTGYMLACKIAGVNQNDVDTWEKFSTEFAAMSHHDNCMSGLLAHTYKLLYSLSVVKQLYPYLSNFCGNYSCDLLFLGAFLHDIGKVDEMSLGNYQPNSIVTHRILGLEYIYPYKDEIINLYDEKFYYMLVSIIVQHHDEWGDKCRTLPAKIVNLLDVLDAQFTEIGQKLETEVSSNTVGTTIKLNGSYLNF